MAYLRHPYTLTFFALHPAQPFSTAYQDGGRCDFPLFFLTFATLLLRNQGRRLDKSWPLARPEYLRAGIIPSLGPPLSR